MRDVYERIENDAASAPAMKQKEKKKDLVNDSGRRRQMKISGYERHSFDEKKGKKTRGKVTSCHETKKPKQLNT